MESSSLCKVYKSIRTISRDGCIINERIVSVEGKSLKEASKEFDKKWRKDKNE
jgi:hypothetical protein